MNKKTIMVKITILENLNSIHNKGIQKLIDEWEYKPIRNHSNWEKLKFNNFLVHRVHSLLLSKDSHCFIATSASRILGCGIISFQKWDSNLLKKKIYRIDFLIANGDYSKQFTIKQVILNEMLAFCTLQSINQLNIRIDSSDLSTTHLVEQSGFISVDGILTFAQNALQHPISKKQIENITIRHGTPADSIKASELAKNIYSLDRFHSDPSIRKEVADNLHREWIMNSFLGSAADKVFVAERKDNIIGFVTCKLQQDTSLYLSNLLGTIVLVAVSENAQGLGIAKSMTLASLEWFSDQGAKIVDVGTQLRNLPASRLYIECGFKYVGSSVSFRKLI